MHSNKPSEVPLNPPDDPSPSFSEMDSAQGEIFLALNQEALAQLVTFVDFAAERLTIAFVEVNFAGDRDLLIETLKQRRQDIQFAVLHFPDPNLRFLRNAILEALPQIQPEPDKKLVLVVTGLEHSIGMVGDYPPVLQDLNYIRDAFTHSVPHPILVCLPDYALTRLANYAPDFWAWRIAVFRFQSTPAIVNAALGQTLQSRRIRGSLDRQEKYERIDLLQRLLMQYAPSGQPETQADLETRIEILNELGLTYYSISEVQKAEDSYNHALTIAIDDKALAQAKAMTLHCIGILKANQGEIEEAIDLYQQSLEIKERIGDMHGRAATLHCLGILKTNQGEIEEAINLYQQSLEINECIGDMQGKAATLHRLGILKANQGEIKEAIDLFQQSLRIKERIGNVHSKAMSLWWLGHLAEEQGDLATALSYLQAAFEILQRIKSSRAAKIQKQFDCIQQKIDSSNRETDEA